MRDSSYLRTTFIALILGVLILSSQRAAESAQKFTTQTNQSAARNSIATYLTSFANTFPNGTRIYFVDTYVVRYATTAVAFSGLSRFQRNLQGLRATDPISGSTQMYSRAAIVTFEPNAEISVVRPGEIASQALTMLVSAGVAPNFAGLVQNSTGPYSPDCGGLVVTQGCSGNQWVGGGNAAGLGITTRLYDSCVVFGSSTMWASWLVPQTEFVGNVPVQVTSPVTVRNCFAITNNALCIQQPTPGQQQIGPGTAGSTVAFALTGGGPLSVSAALLWGQYDVEGAGSGQVTPGCYLMTC